LNVELEGNQRQLVYLSGIKDRFLVNISHEIRTPLNAVLGTVTILESEKLSEKVMKHINVIQKAGWNLMGIIDNILNFKILTKGEIGIEVSDFNLTKELNKICAVYQEEIKEKNLFFDCYNLLDNPEVIYRADLQKITKAISIIIDNAVKFTTDGSIQVTLSVLSSIDERDTIKFTVQDTGKGIAPDLKKHIFTAFSQEDEDYSRDFGGLGMGLAVFEKIMSKLGGEVLFESTRGEGSCFGFILEVEKISDKDLRLAMVDNQDEKVINVLVVEDEEVNLFIAEQLLEKVEMNLNILVAHDGKEGVEMVINEDIDFIFMDLKMPIMNGYEATEIIRNLNKGTKSSTPIVALTAHTQNSERIKCKEYGMDDFLTKPYTIEDLENVMHTYIRNK